MRAARERTKAHSAEVPHAVDAQQAEQEWLRITFSSIADAVITTDPDGLVLFLNPVAARLTGWSLHEALGPFLGEIFGTVQGASQRTDELPIARVVDDGEIIRSDEEVLLIGKDGSARAVEHNTAPIRDAHGKIRGTVIVFRDIAERHRDRTGLSRGRGAVVENWLMPRQY